MAKEFKNFIRLKDGREAEERVVENMPCDEEGVKITEIWTEPKIEKRLSKRIVEHTRPFIHERIVETINEETGEIIETQVESLNDGVRMRLVDHIGLASSVTAQSVPPKPADDCHITREEFQRGLASAVHAAVSAAVESKTEYDYKPEPETVHMQNFVGERVQSQQEGITGKTLAYLSILAVEVAVALYLLFWF